MFEISLDEFIQLKLGNLVYKCYTTNDKYYLFLLNDSNQIVFRCKVLRNSEEGQTYTP